MLFHPKFIQRPYRAKKINKTQIMATEILNTLMYIKKKKLIDNTNRITLVKIRFIFFITIFSLRDTFLWTLKHLSLISL